MVKSAATQNSGSPQESTVAIIDQSRELKYAEALLDGESTHLKALYHFYIHNLLKNTGRTTTTAYRIASHLESALADGEYGKGKKFTPASGAGAKAKVYPIEKAGKSQVNEKDWTLLNDIFAAYSTPVTVPEEDITFKNLIRLTEILGLSEDERKPLQLIYVARQFEELNEFISNVFTEDLKKASIGMARMLDAPLDGRKFAAALSYNARLSRYGLTYFEPTGSTAEGLGLPLIDDEIIEKFDREMTDEQLAAILLDKSTRSELDIADFAHVGEQLDFVLTLIKKSVENGERGINVVLHGPAGSGKTELASAIAKHLNFAMYSIGEPGNEDGMEYTEVGTKRSASDIRISKLQRTHALLEGSKSSIVLFDEIEDLLMKGTDSSKSADVDNKLEVNRLLENNPVVTIWTGNDPEKFHTAVRQRFTYSIMMDYPPTLVREKVWKRRLELEKVSLPEADIRALAREYEAPPRMIAKAVRSMRILGGGVDVIRKSLEADSKIALGQTDGILNDAAIPQDFNLDFINADQDLPGLFNRLVQRGNDKKPFSLLVQSDPSTGAENILRSMAEGMVMNPLEVSMAGLCAPHPMMPPEQKFAAAFAGAADARKFLIITGLEDVAAGAEGDTFFWNNGLVELFAEHALAHKLPFAVTAKANSQLPDHVTMLFSDKVKLLSLQQDKNALLYKQSFGLDLPQSLLKDMSGLTAEDFNKAKSFAMRLDLKGDERDHDRLVHLLTQFKKRRGTVVQPAVGFD
jgi:transitional endoplasmic reticulum ATPase